MTPGERLMYDAWLAAYKGTGPETPATDGILPVFSDPTWRFWESPEFLGYIEYDPGNDIDRLHAEAMAQEMKRAESLSDVVDAIDTAGTAAEITVRLYSAPLDTVLSITEFADNPNYLSAAGMLPFTPVPVGKVDDVVAKIAKYDEEAAGLAKAGARTSGLVRGANPSRLAFEGMEVRAVRSLSHVDDSTLRAMAKNGFAPKDINGKKLILHHLDQSPAGPIVEMPGFRHSIGNRIQHPRGNAPGAGLTDEERAAFDAWRESYWKARASEELNDRGINP